MCASQARCYRWPLRTDRSSSLEFTRGNINTAPVTRYEISRKRSRTACTSPGPSIGLSRRVIDPYEATSRIQIVDSLSPRFPGRHGGDAFAVSAVTDAEIVASRRLLMTSTALIQDASRDTKISTCTGKDELSRSSPRGALTCASDYDFGHGFDVPSKRTPSININEILWSARFEFLLRRTGQAIIMRVPNYVYNRRYLQTVW